MQTVLLPMTRPQMRLALCCAQPVVAEDVDAAIAELEAEKLALAGGTMTGDLLGTNASEGATSATSKISGFAATLNAHNRYVLYPYCSGQWQSDYFKQ